VVYSNANPRRSNRLVASISWLLAADNSASRPPISRDPLRTKPGRY
jgi:hypothetical protein